MYIWIIQYHGCTINHDMTPAYLLATFARFGDLNFNFCLTRDKKMALSQYEMHNKTVVPN